MPMNTPPAEQPNPYAPPKAAVADVVESAPGAELADRSTRLWATVLDGLIFTVAVELPAGIGFVMHARARGHTLQYSDMLNVGSAIGLVALIIWLVVTIGFVKTNGQTIAKRALDIKVVRTDGSPVSLARMFWLRNAINFVAGVIPYVGGIYSLIDALMIYGEPRQCLHDKIADTIVIKT
jgi:uncharacterized RDD family membrane protein YckC